jgi:phage tail-like protein
MTRQDPLRGFRFLVEYDGIVSGGFTRIKGLTRDVKYESYREGGVNEYEHKLVTQVSYPVIVLERGFVFHDLWSWAQSCANGEITRKTLFICLQNEARERIWAWQVVDALPVKWSVSDLDAQSSQVVMESLELAHHGFREATP